MLTAYSLSLSVELTKPLYTSPKRFLILITLLVYATHQQLGLRVSVTVYVWYSQVGNNSSLAATLELDGVMLGEYNVCAIKL